MESENYKFEYVFNTPLNVSDEVYKNIKTKLENVGVNIVDSELTGGVIKFGINFKKKLPELLEREREYTIKSKTGKIDSNVFNEMIKAVSSEVLVIKNHFEVTIFKDRIVISVKKFDLTDTSNIYLKLYFEHITSVVLECVNN